MNKEKNVPIDIESALEYGIDNWYAEFSWPMSWEDFLEIEEAVVSGAVILTSIGSVNISLIFLGHPVILDPDEKSYLPIDG